MPHRCDNSLASARDGLIYSPSPKPSIKSRRFGHFSSRRFDQFTVAKSQHQLATIRTICDASSLTVTNPLRSHQRATVRSIHRRQNAASARDGSHYLQRFRRRFNLCIATCSLTVGKSVYTAGTQLGKRNLEFLEMDISEILLKHRMC